MSSRRVIYLSNSLGRRQFREVLGNLLVGLVLSPTDIWLVSPWVTDFEVLDNSSGDWNAVDPAWERRHLNFSEILIRTMQAGSCLRLVTNGDPVNKAFIHRLRIGIPDVNVFQSVESDRVHFKGLLTKTFFISGSMNFTYSGTKKNEERIELTVDPDEILEAQLEFNERFNPH